MPSPGLDRREPTDDPRGLVLMLHGGAKSGLNEVGARSASFRRTSAMRNAISRRILGADLSLWLLRFGVRGWNYGSGPEPSPVPDARWALDQAAAAHPGVPVVLLGHSMGARTAVYVADHPAVVGVVAMAPWLEPQDPVDTLDGRHLIAGHGSRDKITSARMTRAYVDRAESVNIWLERAGCRGDAKWAAAAHVSLPSSVPSLEGTTWEGSGTTFEFLAGNRLTYQYTGGATDTGGAWRQDGRAILIEVNDCYAEYEGRIEGDAITGEYSNEVGGREGWTAHRSSRPPVASGGSR